MKNIATVHCQQCGSQDAEDVGFDALRRGDGYTACCNERAIYPTTINLYTGRKQEPKCTPEECSHK